MRKFGLVYMEKTKRICNVILLKHPHPPMGAQPWGVVTSHKNFFLFF